MPRSAGQPTNAGQPRSAGRQQSQHQTAVEAVRAISRASRVIERACGELGLAQYRVLSAIASGDRRASRVAVRLALGKPTISATVDSLCQHGLLLRTAAEGDNRANALCLTAEGAAVLAHCEGAMVARLGEICSRAADPEGLLESLQWLGEALEAAASERQVEVSRGGAGSRR